MEQLLEELAFPLTIGKLLSMDYFIFSSDTKDITIDNSTSTKAVILFRILVVTAAVYLSFKPIEEFSVISIFQAVECISINVLLSCLYVIIYRYQKQQVKTYHEVKEVENTLAELNFPVPSKFRKSLRRLLLLIAFMIGVTLSCTFCYSCWFGAADLLSFLITTMALSSFYKTLSFITVFMYIWKEFLTMNRCLERIAGTNLRRKCKICDVGLGAVAPKEQMCELHLIRWVIINFFRYYLFDMNLSKIAFLIEAY